MLRCKRKGYTIEINLLEEYGYKDYSVECTYKYNSKLDKYSLSMWLKRNDIGDKFKIESREIDTQYITSTREVIEDDICRIVEYACETKFFDCYVDQYEYIYKCFDKGDELFETERLADAS